MKLWEIDRKPSYRNRGLAHIDSFRYSYSTQAVYEARVAKFEVFMKDFSDLHKAFTECHSVPKITEQDPRKYKVAVLTLKVLRYINTAITEDNIKDPLLTVLTDIRTFLLGVVID